jgi:hypothetical protein
VSAYSTTGWSELFICTGGATAALSRLIFVGLSVNLEAVLQADRGAGDNFLTGRALEALVALLNVTVISIVALTPTIARGVLAAFILLVAAESAISPARVASQPPQREVARIYVRANSHRRRPDIHAARRGRHARGRRRRWAQLAAGCIRSRDLHRRDQCVDPACGGAALMVST